jgi:hypothetical protein
MALGLRRLRPRRSSPLDEAIAALVASTEASRIRTEEAKVAIQRHRASAERTRAVMERQRGIRVGIRAATERSMWNRAVAFKRQRPMPHARRATVNRSPRHAPVRRRSTATRGSPRSTDPPDEPHDEVARPPAGLVGVVREQA